MTTDCDGETEYVKGIQSYYLMRMGELTFFDCGNGTYYASDFVQTVPGSGKPNFTVSIQCFDHRNSRRIELHTQIPAQGTLRLVLLGGEAAKEKIDEIKYGIKERLSKELFTCLKNRVTK